MPWARRGGRRSPIAKPGAPDHTPPRPGLSGRRRMPVSEITVRIARLEPMRVASVQAFSENPERDAWEKLQLWAEAQGYLDRPEEHPVFGFNSPGPGRGGQRYGYEFWIRVGPEAAAEGGVEFKDFPGGLYAVTTCKLLGDPTGSVMEVWQKLWTWAQQNGHHWRKTHELEKLHDPRAPAEELVLDLYLPIES